MTKGELEKLADRYQKKADTAYMNYQETGVARYDTARRNNEDIAEALWMAAAASEDHAALIHLRCTLANLASKADSIQWAPEAEKEEKMKNLVREVLASARLSGIVI